MRVLIVGGGGREHALAHYISKSPQLTALYAAPGNPGIAEVATCLPLKADAVDSLVEAALFHKIDLVVVGPEDPLAKGLVDQLVLQGIPAFGPGRDAARLESSKAWAKSFMEKYNIPTAGYRVFTDFAAAWAYAAPRPYPQVVKASGLAAGKGAVIVHSPPELESTLRAMLLDDSFGAAGREVVIEDFLRGQEVTQMVLVKGQDYLLLPPAQDHKAVFDGDQGPNTGGMGVLSPVAVYTPEIERETIEQILLPTLHGLKSEGVFFSGLLYLGLMLTAEGPQVIEYNARFGDPETQAVLPRLESDLLTLLWAFATGAETEQPPQELQVKEDTAVSVIMAAPGYPGEYARNLPISGLEEAQAGGCLVFQAGTKEEEGELLSSGGRILAVTALGQGLDEALHRAYAGVRAISIPGAHYRQDIGRRG